MKALLLFLFLISLLVANEHRLLLTGFTLHENDYSDSGEKFNEFNYGAGYEYTTFKNYDELYFATNITILKDSFSATQYTLSGSQNIRYELIYGVDISIGLALFIMYKEENYRLQPEGGEVGYGFIPGAAPLASIYYKDFDVNVAYVPSFKYEEIATTGFMIVYFGWKL